MLISVRMLRLTDVLASYGAAPVLQGVTLHVERGETVALLGPNGAGKSTLLAAITGTLAHRTGSITVDATELVREKSHAIVARGLALVPEGRLVFAPYSVEDNLRLGAVQLKGELGERYQYVYALFPRLAERRRQVAGTLSGGEQQMLAIGRALMGNPRVLLMDEPSEGLAPLIVAEVGRTIARLKAEGQSIVLVEQNVKLAFDLADEVAILNTGRVAFAGPASASRDNESLITQQLGVF